MCCELLIARLLLLTVETLQSSTRFHLPLFCFEDDIHSPLRYPNICFQVMSYQTKRHIKKVNWVASERIRACRASHHIYTSVCVYIYPSGWVRRHCFSSSNLSYPDIRQVILFKTILHLVLRIMYMQCFIQYRSHLPAQAVSILFQSRCAIIFTNDPSIAWPRDDVAFCANAWMSHR